MAKTASLKKAIRSTSAGESQISGARRGPRRRRPEGSRCCRKPALWLLGSRIPHPLDLCSISRYARRVKEPAKSQGNLSRGLPLRRVGGHGERVRGIEPPSLAWEARALPLSYTRRKRPESYCEHRSHPVVPSGAVRRLVHFRRREEETLILSDRDIFEAIAADRIGIEPFDKVDLQPSSVDLHVDRLFRTFHNARYPFIDVKKPMEDLTELIEVDEQEAFILHPGEFVLGSTAEYVRLPNDLVARLEGKSSLGRLGLLIHSTAGYVDPGFEGHLTLELSNVANLPITIYPFMKIGQISFFQLTSEAENPYGTKSLGSKYQGQRGPTPSRFYENFS
jgi:dCTP deaminase